MAKKVLVFGGEALPAGTHTYYLKKEADGSETECRAEVGHQVAFDEVVNAQYFLDTKRASVADSKAASAQGT